MSFLRIERFGFEVGIMGYVLVEKVESREEEIGFLIGFSVGVCF